MNPCIIITCTGKFTNHYDLVSATKNLPNPSVKVKSRVHVDVHVDADVVLYCVLHPDKEVKVAGVLTGSL